MDGDNNGKPYFLMDDLGVKNPLFSVFWNWKKLPLLLQGMRSQDNKLKELVVQGLGWQVMAVMVGVTRCLFHGRGNGH